MRPRLTLLYFNSILFAIQPFFVVTILTETWLFVHFICDYFLFNNIQMIIRMLVVWEEEWLGYNPEEWTGMGLWKHTLWEPVLNGQRSTRNHLLGKKLYLLSWDFSLAQSISPFIKREGRSKCSGFTSHDFSCHPSLHTVSGYILLLTKNWPAGG